MGTLRHSSGQATGLRLEPETPRFLQAGSSGPAAAQAKRNGVVVSVIKRSFWLSRIEELWQKRSVIWLAGVRRVGKTVLCQTLPNVEYFDCELPRVRQRMEDPESFFRSLQKDKIRIVVDEIHRLGNPSELLKIAADHFPNIKVIATGSSTLAASGKFRDTLTGRKRSLLLTPMILQDLIEFGSPSLPHRFLHGGLPPFFAESTPADEEFLEWMDAFWSKDILDLFRLERRYSFLKFVELIFIQSGSMFEATRFAAPCEVSRTTIMNYLSVLEATFVAHVLRPFSMHQAAEIVSAPKVYAFDTGFVSYYKGWQKLRNDDMGHLWEHFVLNELVGVLQTTELHYWRDKADHEIDFVIPSRKGDVDAIECKWSSRTFDPSSLLSFRRRHPTGRNFIVCGDLVESFTSRKGELSLEFTTLRDLVSRLEPTATK